MQKTTLNQTYEFETEIICDIPRLQSDLYRIAQRIFQDIWHIDLRVFYMPKESPETLRPTQKGVCFPKEVLPSVIDGLVKAQAHPAVSLLEGMKVLSVHVCDIKLTETRIIRINKGCGPNNGFVSLRKGEIQKGTFYPSTRKGLTILLGCLDEVIKGLKSIE